MKNLLLTLTFLFFTILCFQTNAQVVKSFTPRFQTTQRGGIVYLANVAVSCDADPTASVTSSCKSGTAEVPPNGNYVDNSFVGKYVDVDGDNSTFMSSSDKLDLPNCSSITWAGLFWGAEGSASTTGYKNIKIKVDNGSYQSLTADVSMTNTAGYTSYHNFKDVTSIVKAAGTKARFTLADMPFTSQQPDGKNQWGGWSIVVVYANETEGMKQLTVFDGLSSVSNSGVNNTVIVPISGFLTPPTGPVNIQVGDITYDGDRGAGYTGDNMAFNGVSNNYVNITDALNPLNDVMNSTVSYLGALTPNRIPNLNNTAGLDADIFLLDNTNKQYIGNSATSANLKLTTGGETYLTQVVTTAIDVYEPELTITKTVVDEFGNDAFMKTVAPGSLLTYTITVKNISPDVNDISKNTFVTDQILQNAIYVPNSLVINSAHLTDQSGDDRGEFSNNQLKVRIGTGANSNTGGQLKGGDQTVITYKVTAETDCFKLNCNNEIDNTAIVTGTGSISGNVQTKSSNPSAYDAFGCPINGSTTTFVNISKLACATPPDKTITVCSGNSSTFSTLFPDLATLGFVFYDASDAMLTTPLSSPSQTTSTIYHAVKTSYPGCSYTVNVTVNVALKPSVPTPFNVCAGESADLTASTTNGTWSTINSNPQPSTTTLGTASVAFPLATASGNYDYIYTDNTGCSSTTTITILTPPTAPTVTPSTINCGATTGGVDINGLPSGTWTIKDAFAGSWTGNATAYTISGLNLSTAYSFTVKDAAGCTSQLFIATTVNPKTIPPAPSANNLTVVAPTCSVNTGTVTLNNLDPNSTYYYSINGGSYTLYGNTFTLNAGDNYSIKAVNNTSGCENPTSFTMPDQPSAPSNIVIAQTPATCNALSNPNYDGIISFTSATNAVSYGISSFNASSYNGADYSSATLLNSLPTNVKTNVPNTGGTYILRVYGTNGICYVDKPITVTEVLCGVNSCTNTLFPVGSSIVSLDWVTPPNNSFTMNNFYVPGSPTPFVVNKSGPTASTPPTPFTIYAPGNLTITTQGVINYTGFCTDLTRVLYTNNSYNDYKVEPLEYLDKEVCGLAGTPAQQIPDGGVGPIRAGMIRYLVDQHYIGTNSTDPAWTNNNYGIAFQIALWELVHDQYNVANINFTVKNATTDGLYVDYNANSAAGQAIIDQAETWVKDIQSKVWDWTAYVPTKWHTVALNTNSAQDLITVEPLSVCAVSGVSSGGSGGLESKSLGAAIGERNFNLYKNGKNGPVQYLPSELMTGPSRVTFGTFGVTNSNSLASLMPYKVSSSYLPYDKSAAVSDLKSITNAVDVRAIDFTLSNTPRAAAFATKTVGGIYSHTKPICDRLKGAQLLDIQNVQIQGLNFIQYKIQQPDGDLEYAVSFSAGAKSGRSNYSVQSNWLMPDYASEDTMFNYQLWAASPVDAQTMVTEVLGKLQSNMPVAQLSTTNDLPEAYVSAASRQGTNLNLTVNNRTSSTSGYFTLTQKSTENTSASDNIVVPFTVNANGKTVVSIPVGDSYDADISMVFNNKTTDMLYMADGIWGTSTDNQTTVSQFNVNNDNNRTYADNEYALMRDVQVQVTTPSYLSIYKYLKGGAVAANLNAYKSFHFTTNTNAEGMNLQVTITKQSVTSWNSQYTYTISNYQDGKTYKLALSDFKSADSTLPALMDASDITSVVYNVINPTGQSVNFTTGISNAAFSTEDIAFENSLQAKAVSVSPNPNNGNFKVSFSSPSAAQLRLKVIDVAGKVISTKEVNAVTGKNEVSVSIGQAVKGSVYFVTLEGAGIKYNTKEMIIKR